MHDLNAAIREEADLVVFSQLNQDAQVILYTTFLFPKFLRKFSRTFQIANTKNGNKNSYYSFYDQVYREFLMEIMQNLEPIQIEKNSVIFAE